MRMVFEGWLLVSVLTALPGCSAGDDSLAEVTGQVTLNGLPVAAEILFQPEDEDGHASGRASSAFSDDKGRFELSYSADRPGAEIGRHRVSIKVLQTQRPDDTQTYDRGMIPLKTTRFTRVVQPGENHFYFAMTF